MKRKITVTAATAAAAATLTLAGCSSNTSASSSPAQHKPQAQGQQQSQQGGGGWAAIPDTPPPAHETTNASQACIRQQQDWNLGVGSSGANPGPLFTSGAQENAAVGNDASSLQGQVANPYNQSQVTDQPDRTTIATAANHLLTDLPKAEAKPFPTCADTAGYFPAGMHYYRLAAQAALAGSYGQTLTDLRTGSDAMAWMTSEPNDFVGFNFSQPTGDY